MLEGPRDLEIKLGDCIARLTLESTLYLASDIYYSPLVLALNESRLTRAPLGPYEERHHFRASMGGNGRSDSIVYLGGALAFGVALPNVGGISRKGSRKPGDNCPYIH